MIIMFLLLIPVVIWLALKVAMCYSTELKLFDMLSLLTASLNQPLYLHLNEYSLKAVFVFFCLSMLAVWVYILHQAKTADRASSTARQNGVMFQVLHENIQIESTG